MFIIINSNNKNTNIYVVSHEHQYAVLSWNWPPTNIAGGRFHYPHFTDET